jgi:thiol-disulfide isomerase/thioredoxin
MMRKTILSGLRPHQTATDSVVAGRVVGNGCRAAGNGWKGILAVLILLWAQFGLVYAKADELRVGSPAPDLIGIDPETGDRLNLSRVMTETRVKRDSQGNPMLDSDGRALSESIHYVTVLVFFSSRCNPCVKELPTLNRVAADSRRRPVRFLFVVVDPDIDIESIRRLIDQYRIESPVMLTDPAGANRQYGAGTLPHLVIVDRSRRIAYIQTGFDEDLAERLAVAINRVLFNEANRCRLCSAGG